MSIIMVIGNSSPLFAYDQNQVWIQGMENMVESLSEEQLLDFEAKNAQKQHHSSPENDTKEIIISATVTSGNQTVTINPYFKNAFKISRGDETSTQKVKKTITHTYTEKKTYFITLTTDSERRTFQNTTQPLFAQEGTTVENLSIITFPSLSKYFGESENIAGANYFAHFNHQGALTSLGENTFDTSSLTTAGNNFFESFNE